MAVLRQKKHISIKVHSDLGLYRFAYGLFYFIVYFNKYAILLILRCADRF